MEMKKELKSNRNISSKSVALRRNDYDEDKKVLKDTVTIKSTSGVPLDDSRIPSSLRISLYCVQPLEKKNILKNFSLIYASFPNIDIGNYRLPKSHTNIEMRTVITP